MLALGGATAHAEPRPLGLACVPQDGVRFCPGNGTTQRVPSWDGTPLDADVTLPTSGDGPWPTIVLLHGLGGHKRQLSPTAPSLGNGRAPKIFPNTDNHSNVSFARQGYAVLAYSARGFGASCGAGGTPAAQLQLGPCATGFVRIADQRYEARDTQHLLGLLADENVVKSDAIGATGFSYGGGQAVQLGYLRDKIRLPDGRYAPWRSPQGKSMAFTAIYGQWLWSDLISALLPNGRFLDDDPSTNDASLRPLGVEIFSYANALFALADLDGYVVLPQVPGSTFANWDLTTAIAQLALGEPYGPAVQSIAREFREYHGGFGIPGPHAAMLLESGWNDDVFPPLESLRVYNDLRTRAKGADVALLLGDYGHGRAANDPGVAKAFNDQAAAFFAEHLLGQGAGPRPGSVLAYSSACGTARPVAFAAPSWRAVHRRVVTAAAPGRQAVRSPGGNPTIGLNFDPIPNTNPLGTADPCKTIAATRPPDTATAELRSDGFQMLGLPTITANVTTSGAGGQLAGRLWDVTPDGRQRLVTRGVYRLTDDQTGHIRFQLRGNGYRFEPGHVAKLELSGSDAPTFRPSNGIFRVEVADLRVELPLATPCTNTRRIRLPRAQRAKTLKLTVFSSGQRERTLKGRALRKRTITLRDLPEGRPRVHLQVRVTRKGKRRTIVRKQTLRVCS